KPRRERGFAEGASCGKAGAPVLGGAGCHRRLSPDRREPARGIPTSGQARAAEDRSLEAREISELDRHCRHGRFRPARFFTPARTLCIAAYGFLISERETIPPSGDQAQTGLGQGAYLCQRDLGLGLEPDLVRNPYLAPTFAIARPFLRQIQSIATGKLAS